MSERLPSCSRAAGHAAPTLPTLMGERLRFAVRQPAYWLGLTALAVIGILYGWVAYLVALFIVSCGCTEGIAWGRHTPGRWTKGGR